MGFFFLFVAVFASYGIFRVVRTGQRERKYLQESKGDAPLAIEHLPRALQEICREARVLRISLESPIRSTTR